MNGFFAHAKPYLPHLLRYRKRIALLAALMLGASTLEGVGISLFYPLIQYMLDGPAVFLSHGAGRLVARGLAVAGLQPSIGAFIVGIFLVIVSALALKYWVFVMSSRVYNPLMKDLRDEAFKRTLSSHIFVFTSSSSANLSQTLENEVDHVGQAFNFSALIAAGSLSLAVYGACALYVSWRLTVLVGVLGGLRYFVSGAFVRRIHEHGHEHGSLRTLLKSRLTALHQGIDVVKSFGAEEREQRRFESLTEAINANGDAIDRTKAINSFSEGMLGEGLLCIVVYVAVSRLSVAGATLLTFLFVVSRIIPKIAAINDARVHLSEFLSKTERLPTVLTDGGLQALRWGDRRKESFDGSVVFENVSFRYPETVADAVADLDLKLERRRTLALVGESGSGKSTLTRLLLRLFDPTKGRILVDGIPLPELRREDWTRLISVVSQDTFVFDDTLENNVRYGAPDCSAERFREALRLSRADEFVERMPLKEKTEIGERGVRLSGGQRQRLAIARAFLRDSPILILDEATSAMDSATERRIQEALDELARDRTLLVVAHRLSTIRKADRIVVLERGRVAESGTHAELVARENGLYRGFHELQNR